MSKSKTAGIIAGIKQPANSHRLPAMDETALTRELASIGYSLPEFCRAVLCMTGNTITPQQVREGYERTGRLSQPLQAAIRLGIMQIRQYQDGDRAGKAGCGRGGACGRESKPGTIGI